MFDFLGTDNFDNLVKHEANEEIPINYLNKAKKDLVTSAGKYVESKTGIKRSKRYWKILLIKTVSDVVDVVYNRYRSVSKAEKTKINVRSLKSNEIEVKSRSDLIRRSKYEKKINKNMIKELKKSAKNTEIYISKNNTLFYTKKFAEYIHSTILKAKRCLSSCDKTGDVDNEIDKEKKFKKKDEEEKYDIGIFEDKINISYGTLRKIDENCKLSLQKIEYSTFKKGDRKTEKTNEEISKEEYKSKSLCHKLIRSILENRILDEYMKAISNLDKDALPSVVLDSFLADDVAQRVLVAEAVENGATLVSVQHGGWYGELEYHANEWCEREIADAFATWGYEKSKKDKRLPALKYAKWSDHSLSRGGSGLLWLSKSIDSWGDYIYPSTIYEKIDMKYDGEERYERSKNMYDNIEEYIQRGITLRFDYKVLPDTSEYASQLKRRIDREFESLRLDPGGVGLEERVDDAALVLVDHVPSTVFGECVHIGVPTLLFDKIEDKALTDQAREAYRALEDAGVLHQSASEAAAKINEVYPDPRAWWRSDDVQEAVQRYIDEFAYLGEEPIEEWVSFLETLPVQKT